MASIGEAIKRLIYQFTSEGADKVAADMNKVADAQTTTSRSAVDLSDKFSQLERKFDPAVRNAQDYAKVQAQVQAAVAQNASLHERGNVVLELAAARYG